MKAIFKKSNSLYKLNILSAFVFLCGFLCVFILSCLFSFGINSKKVSAKKKVTEELSISKLSDGMNVKIGDNTISAYVSCKNYEYIKYGRYMNLTVNIINQRAEDFSGYLRVELPGGKNTMYQKEVSVKAQNENEVNFVYPAEFNENYFYFSLVDSRDVTIDKKAIGLNLTTYSDVCYIGVISDNEDSVSYMKRGDTELFFIDEFDISSDYKELDIFDVIVINSYSDIYNMDEDRINSILMWVDHGGTLVVSADKGNSETITAFNGLLYNLSSISEPVKRETSFGLQNNHLPGIKEELEYNKKKEKVEQVKRFLKNNLSADYYKKWSMDIANLDSDSTLLSKSGEIYNELVKMFSKSMLDEKLSLNVDSEDVEEKSLQLKSEEKVITPFTIQNATALINENGEKLVQYIDNELGRVILFETGLSLNKSNRKVLGTQITDIITNNMSSEGKSKLRNESRNMDNSTASYYYMEGLKKNDNDNLPNLFLYALILIIYLLINGPVIFYVLRKRKRFAMIWASVPMIAVVFSVLIYLLGAKTRIEAPYSNYLSQLRILDTGQSQLSTYFSLTSPNNKAYTMDFEGNRDITPLTPDSDRAQETGEVKSTKVAYDYGIEYNKDATKILMKNVYSFEERCFCDRTTVKTSNGIKTDIVKDKDDFLGKIENSTKYNLVNCFLYDNGYVVKVGDVKKGDSIEFSTKDEPGLKLTPEDYDYDLVNLGAVLLNHEISDKNYKYSITEQRMRSLISAYVNSPMNSQGVFIYGFIDGYENDFIKKFGVKNSGITAVCQDINLSYRYDNFETIPDISKFAVNYDENQTDSVNVFGDDYEEISVTYKLPDGFSAKSLIYDSDQNGEFNIFNSAYTSIFSGNVKVVDLKTKKKKTLFEGGFEKSIDDIYKYIDDNNMFTLVYKIDKRVDVDDYRLPTLMMAIYENEDKEGEQ
ncbi:MAG: hypothetical protein K6D02_06235 [Lachnospiraceae bacterium]|nr:hypothetical protein [Lachnospiraceae bacterium]